MKFKLVEKFDETRSMVQEYMYDAMDELNNASLEEYIQWFMSELTYFDETVEQAVTDAYIEACDYGMIKGVEKTRLTSELKEYIESHTDIIDDTDELMRQCPEHLQHELKIVLSKLDESLNESVIEEAIRPDLKRFIEQHAELLDENNIEELYKQCPRELKIPLVRMLNAASLSDNIESIKRATYLADNYDDDELIDLALSVTDHVNDVFDAFDYIMNNWNEFFTDDVLNEKLLTEEKYLKVSVSYPITVESDDLNVPSEVYDYVYVIVDNKDANVSAISTMFDTGKYKHETVDNYWRNLLKQSVTIHDMTEVTIEDIYADPDFETHLYTKTNRKLRDNTRNNVLTELDNDTSLKFAVGNYKIYVHHPDENELNTNAKDNSYILYNGNKYFPIVIHQLLHMTHVDPRILGTTGKTYIPVVVFDKSLNKYVQRQIEVSLRIC